MNLCPIFLCATSLPPFTQVLLNAQEPSPSKSRQLHCT